MNQSISWTFVVRGGFVVLVFNVRSLGGLLAKLLLLVQFAVKLVGIAAFHALERLLLA